MIALNYDPPISVSSRLGSEAWMTTAEAMLGLKPQDSCTPDRGLGDYNCCVGLGPCIPEKFFTN